MTCDEFWVCVRVSPLALSRAQRAAVLRHDSECKPCHEMMDKMLEKPRVIPLDKAVAIVRVMAEDECDPEYREAKGVRE